MKTFEDALILATTNPIQAAKLICKLKDELKESERERQLCFACGKCLEECNDNLRQRL